jgi:hypothetical protein
MRSLLDTGWEPANNAGHGQKNEAWRSTARCAARTSILINRGKVHANFNLMILLSKLQLII